MTSRNGATIEVTGVSKWFGSVVAINDISFQVSPGVTGLLGPNGAGKTTLLHMIAGLSGASKGDVRVLGQQVRGNHRIYERLGVMSEHEAVYGFMTGREFVEFSARMQGVKNVPVHTAWAIGAVNLLPAQNRPLNTYSRGMRQRMRLAAALVHDPEVLILDEPLNGTDPRQRIEFQNLMHREGQQGRTILISSHILEEVETLAGAILLIVSGKLAAAGDFRAIREKLEERPFQVRVLTAEPRAVAAALMAIPAVDSVEVTRDGALIVLSRDIGTLQRSIPKLARDAGVRLYSVEPLDESLDSVFSYVVRR